MLGIQTLDLLTCQSRSTSADKPKPIKSHTLVPSVLHLIIIIVLISTMKIFVTLLAIVALASAQDNCQRCGHAVQHLGEYLLTDAEIAAVEQGLVDLVCTTLPEENIEECAVTVF